MPGEPEQYSPAKASDETQGCCKAPPPTASAQVERKSQRAEAAHQGLAPRRRTRRRATGWGKQVRNFTVSDHRFHAKAITDFTAKRSAFSPESDRRFRTNPINKSAPR